MRKLVDSDRITGDIAAAQRVASERLNGCDAELYTSIVPKGERDLYVDTIPHDNSNRGSILSRAHNAHTGTGSDLHRTSYFRWPGRHRAHIRCHHGSGWKSLWHGQPGRTHWR